MKGHSQLPKHGPDKQHFTQPRVFYLRPSRSIRWPGLIISQQTHYYPCFLVSIDNIGFSLSSVTHVTGVTTSDKCDHI